MADAPTLNDVQAAAEAVAGHVHRTPMLTSATLAERCGAPVWLKAELFQRIGAFKPRGAFNRLRALTPEERALGTITISAGNHAQALALAARDEGVDALVLMPADASPAKVAAARGYGATVDLESADSMEALERMRTIAAETGRVIVHPYDDPLIVAGQGTVGIEILEQLGRSPARIVVPCGGGGLASGIALACPDAEIVVVEPEGWDDMQRSLEEGEIVPVGPNPPKTFCDAIMTPRVSPITFGILSDRHATALSVSDGEVEDAIRFAWDQHQLVVEPGAAVALAAVLAGKVPADEDTVIVVSGGNIDPALHARIVSEAA